MLYDDQIFRLILIVGFCSVCPIALYHRLKSQASGERLDRSQEGIFILATLRPLGLASMAGLVAFMIDPDWMRWSQVGLPAWARWGGVGIGACTGALLIWVFDSLGKNITDTVVTRRDHTLVTTGPLPVGSTPVLSGRRGGNSCQLPGHCQLVPGTDQWARLRADRPSHQDRGRKADRTVRRRLSKLYEPYREVPPSPGSMTISPMKSPFELS